MKCGGGSSEALFRDRRNAESVVAKGLNLQGVAGNAPPFFLIQKAAVGLGSEEFWRAYARRFGAAWVTFEEAGAIGARLNPESASIHCDNGVGHGVIVARCDEGEAKRHGDDRNLAAGALKRVAGFGI